uniref:Beta-lactamase domain-containing protein n=1 Tax=Syphacia muris TaxID=451379 RepID=A0A0N5APA3_9BILA
MHENELMSARSILIIVSCLAYYIAIGDCRSASSQRKQHQDDLQIVHAQPPNEQDWVMAVGNESAVDNVLAISLVYGGRLASLGYFSKNDQLYYYAIMHKYPGPVFLKPGPLTLSELLKTVKENEQRSLALTQVCGQEDRPGRVTFSTYWERVPGVEFEVWFPGTLEALKQRRSLENRGYRLSYLCGYSVMGYPQYIGVWQKPTLSLDPYEAHYGLTLNQCLAKDKSLINRGFIAVQFRVFTSGIPLQVLCTAIWQYLPGRRHYIEIGPYLDVMYTKLGRKTEILPRQISHFYDRNDQIQFVVLWSDYDSNRYPAPPPLWKQSSRIPVNYLDGSEKLLSITQRDFLVKRVEHFMKDMDIPGLSVAIVKNERLKFAAGFGYADVRKKDPVTPQHQFRIGSVSKPITAAAVLMLVDQGKLDLDERVFGKNSIFGMEFAKKRLYQKYVMEVTVRHLLQHTAGGWDNLENDPAWIEPQFTTRRLIEFVVENVPLTKKPGTTWIYSNFGYQLLGYIIERKTGLTYEEYVKQNLWLQLGVQDIQIAGATISDRASREVLYYMSGNKIGFNPYEMLPPDRIGPWGGWIASPIELLHFMTHTDGFHLKKDILSEESIEDWSTATKASNETYGLGWSINVMGFNGWQHDGRMPGSAAMLVRLDNGLEMAVVVNKEYSERDFFHEMGYVLHHIGNNHDWWNDNEDLFSIA